MLLYRFGAVIPVPFINVELLKTVFQQYAEGLFGFVNIMSGGAFAQATIFALSIQPYINASIIINLLTVAIPALERMVKEGGEDGQKKLSAWTRYTTVAIALIMGTAYYITLNSRQLVTVPGIWTALVIIFSFTAGSALIMWLGEQVTENGIGNGISIILFVSIISRGPSMVTTAVESVKAGTLNFIGIVGVIVLMLLVVAFVVFMSNAERRISVQYAKRVVGRKMYGGQTSYIPLRVNATGVLPIIFASSIVSLPSTIAAFIPNAAQSPFWTGVQNLFSYRSVFYAILYFVLIIAFGYFYAAVQFNPIEIANNMRKNGGFIPGLRPGKPTSDFITKSMNKITLMGSLFLGVIATIPIVMSSVFNLGNFALSGTTVIIVVGVALETVKQLEAQMLMRHYKGFLE
jgi:preprotein translocase subunit SecY